MCFVKDTYIYIILKTEPQPAKGRYKMKASITITGQISGNFLLKNNDGDNAGQ